MDLSIDDCDARIFRYYEDFNGIMEDNGLQGLIGAAYITDTEQNERSPIGRKLPPQILKAQISQLVDLEGRDCKSDDVTLFDLILEHAKVQQRFHRISQDHATKGDSKAGKPDRKPQKTGNVNAGAKTEPTRTQSPPLSTSASARAPRPSRPPPQDGCLFCKGAHWLVDCPTAKTLNVKKHRPYCEN
ncbi:LOW QUALITY PROTEIN: hypothetical protein PHMEG_00021287 [Phytophthora megakarya]|uniref:Uncharacterized protein n=1 Tax=Phytophthora megakarya TaxID=4795 RepID=A0A225VMV8_9STRA|nr:LOW QUALITY PROTEIN: hypothetical protein PHMEG_00021287 [Phytophthora megakarya]